MRRELPRLRARDGARPAGDHGTARPFQAGALDGELERLLAAIACRQQPPWEQLGVEAARLAYRESCAAFALPAEPLASVADRLTPQGHRVRIYRPVEGLADLPCLLFLHGGGWVLGDLQTHDPVCRALAAWSGCCVVALDYPRAPEHPYPAALDAACATWRWIRDEAAGLRILPDRIAIGGDSAGGGLAASCCLRLRDAGLPLPRLQVLFYPATDLRGRTASYERVTSGVPLTAARMRWFLAHYLQDPGDADAPGASPLLAASLAGLPPCWLVTSGIDPLRDEGIAYARRLEEEAVPVTHLHLGDQIHGFLTMAGALSRARAVLRQAAEALR